MIAGHGASLKTSPATSGNFTIMTHGVTPIVIIDEKFYTMYVWG